MLLLVCVSVSGQLAIPCNAITDRRYAITDRRYAITDRCYAITDRCYAITDRCYVNASPSALNFVITLNLHILEPLYSKALSKINVGCVSEA